MNLGAPCTTFCDWSLINGGTRTGAQPEGDGSLQRGIEGNIHSELSCELCEVLAEAGKEFLIESTAPSGKYPKAWDLKCYRRLRQLAGARFVPMAMCEWDLAQHTRQILCSAIGT